MSHLSVKQLRPKPRPHTLKLICSATPCAHTPPPGAGLCAPPSGCCMTPSCSTLPASSQGGWGTGTRPWSPVPGSHQQGSRYRPRSAPACPKNVKQKTHLITQILLYSPPCHWWENLSNESLNQRGEGWVTLSLFYLNQN